MVIKKIKKRDGRIVDFEKDKITNAIFKAAKAVGGEDIELAKQLTEKVVQQLEEKFPKEIPSVEDIQDIVEKVLIENGHAATAKAYIIYRKEREESRKAKEMLGVRDELKLPVNTIKVLKARYLLKDEEGNVIESTAELFRRVARHLAIVDILYHDHVFDKSKDQRVKELPELDGLPKKAGELGLNIHNVRMLHKAYQRLNLRKQMKVTFSELLEILKNKWDEIKAKEDEFYGMMANFEFMPNSPTLMNAGAPLGQLSACFTQEQPVLSNPGLKPITEIDVGDRVVTHSGNLEEVTHKFVREIDDYIFRIKVKGLLNPTMSVTAEHPVFGIKKDEFRCSRNKHGVCNGFPKSLCLKKPLDYRDDCRYLKQPAGKPRWIPVKNLKEGDYVVISTYKEVIDKPGITIADILPAKDFILEGNFLKAGGRPNEGKLIPNSINVGNDFMRLIGYWLADGSISKKDGKPSVIRFTSNVKEKEYYEDILKIMREKFNLTTKVEFNKKQHTAQLRFHSTIVAQLFCTLFGRGFDKKDLPAWIMSLPPEKQFHLMIGLFRGDGCHYNGKKQDVFFISLSNYNLATKIWNILMRLGYPFNINSRMPRGGTKKAYRISSPPSLCEDLVKAVGKNNFKKRKIFPQFTKFGDYFLRPISKIEKVRFTGKVYNLEVKNDNSYLANGVAVHNCFVLPIGDSLDSIFDSLKYTALIHQSGGGTGFSFSKLRPNGDMVKSTKGIASGPLSFMRVFDIATEVIKQGGRRRGANMGIMRIDHPDILDFITSKDSENRLLTNFNISVAVTDKFMKALENDAEYDILNPRTGVVFKKLFARQVWEMITYQAWKTGDPGIIFIDEINRHNQTPHIGQIEATNPCVTGNMLVPTEHGLLEMEKLADGHHTSLLVDKRTIGEDDTEISPMLRAWETGKRQTYRLTTKSGYELVATADHKIMTKNGWVKLRELIPGKDRVLIQSGPGMWNTNGKLSFDMEGLPKKWSKELGQALGWLIGDGWLRDADKNRRVGFTFGKEDLEILCHLKKVLNNIYGKEIKEVERENGVYHLSYHGKRLVEFFKKLGVKPVRAEKKEIPEAVFTATEDAVAGFLQGLFTADGTIGLQESNSMAYVRLTSKSEKLLKQVQLLLLNFGIKSRIYDRSRPSRKIFPYVDKKGKKRIYDVEGTCYELNISRGNITKFLDKIGFICGKHDKKVNLLKKRSFYKEVFEDEILEIKPNGEEVVYDLTEPHTHSFICNGIVVSNCGEQPLLPYESCNLGSINLSRMVKSKDGKEEIDWEKLEKVARSSMHFLDNVIDANSYPIKQIEFMTHANRKIGLGVMGFAELLIKLGIRYDSEDALKIGEKIMKLITENGREKSAELGKSRGSFPNFKGSEWDEKDYRHMRNATVTTIAPTGTISIIADCSSGIEPLFAVAFVRKNVLSGDELVDVNKLFEKYAKEKGFYSEELMHEISNTGSLEEIDSIPKSAKELFKTAHDIDYEWHIRMQAAFQKYTDNAVSKTINLRNEASIKDVDNSYILAHKLKCKGVTIYRDMSKLVQVIHIGDEKKKRIKYVKADEEKKELSESDEVCPVCKSKLYSAEGCFTCLSCGYSKCG